MKRIAIATLLLLAATPAFAHVGVVGGAASAATGVGLIAGVL